MKYIKFTLSTRETFSLPMDLAELVLNSKQQLIMIPGPDGKWDGRTLNKAHIVSTTRDLEEEKVQRLTSAAPAIAEHSETITPEDRERIDARNQKIREQLGMKPYSDA